MSLRSRLAAAAAIVVAMLAVGGLVILRTSAATQRGQIDRQITSSLPTAFAIANPNALRPNGAPPGDSFSDLYVAIVTADGSRITVASRIGAGDAAPALPSTASAAPRAPVIETVGSVRGGGRWRATLLDDQQGPRLLLAVSLDRVTTTQHRLEIAVGIVLAATFLALGMAGWWVLRLGLRPIAEVTEAADAIVRGDRERRVIVAPSKTEAGHLARAFNVMLDEHQRHEAKLRRFLADVSHELRTPVASIRGFADLYRQGGLNDDEVRDAMRRIGGESARMADLVDDLVLLARLDEGRPLERVPVDLRSILEDAALDASVTYPSRTVSVTVSEQLIVLGDEARLRQVVTNVVHNALSHAGGDAVVSLDAHASGGVCVIDIADNGVGMTPDEVDHAFGRFWRADASRVRNTGGSGLGLAIVQAIVEAHGGRVALDSVPGKGTHLRLVLPAS